MATRNFNNTTSAGSLSAPATAGATTITVTGFTNYPPAPFTVTLDRGQVGEEIALCTAIASGTLTVTRGYNGTAATSHTAGATVEHTAVALDFSEANAHNNAVANVHGVTGGLVGDEAPQTLLDKTLISPVLEADVTAGDAAVAYVPSGAEARNLFRGMDPDGDDVFIVDSSGRVTGAVATAPEHLVRKQYVDAIGTRVTTAEGTLTAATSAATAGTIAKRDGSGRLAVATPAASGDAATKDYADTLGTSAPTVSTIVRRDSAGRFQAVAPSAAADVAVKSYVDGKFSDTGWQTPTLTSPATSIGTCRYRVLNGVCHFNLATSTPAGTVGNFVIMTFPVGYRPTAAHYFTASLVGGNSGNTQVTVGTDGQMSYLLATPAGSVTVSGSFPIT